MLDSNPHMISLHVTTNNKKGSEWGSLMLSNWNGTHFKEALQYVNRDSRGYVDFEKMETIEGVALANQVSNAEHTMIGGHKEIRTVITFDNGISWKSLKSPESDSAGKPYACTVCSCTRSILKQTCLGR